MIENGLDRFADSLFSYLTGKSKDVRSLLVKKHNENLQTHGDFSFPNSLKSWHEYANCDQVVDKKDTTFLQVIGKECTDIVEESKKWNLQVNKVKDERDRIYLFLERPGTIRVGLSEALRNNVVLAQRIREGVTAVHLDPCCEEQRDLTSLRTKYVCDVINNLCALCKVNSPVFVTSKSTSNSEGYHRVLCGSVLNSKSGAKESNISADDYIRFRQDEMTLIAQHKYGVRVSTDSKWKEFISHLGESAAAFELLQTRPSGAVKINFECSSVGSSKGEHFLNLYFWKNCKQSYRSVTEIRLYIEAAAIRLIKFKHAQEQTHYFIINTQKSNLPILLNTIFLNTKMQSFL